MESQLQIMLASAAWGAEFEFEFEFEFSRLSVTGILVSPIV
jgi:hypothetical protein